MVYGWALGASILMTAFAAAFAGIGVLAVAGRGRSGRRGSAFFEGAAGTVFLFDGETLVDASPSGRALLSAARARGTSWQRLMTFLAPRFPGVAARIAALPKDGRFVVTAVDGGSHGPLTLLAEWRGGLARLSLSGAEADGKIAVLDPMAQRAMEEELGLLRGTVNQAPLPIWLENVEGEIIWANNRYLTLIALRAPEVELAWPLPRLMSVPAADKQRVRIDTAGEQPLWFESHVRPADDGRMIFGLPLDALLQAEAALRDFTQTLTKTFAHLPIGLAIFDRQRQLALFNPALLDLTGLSPEFLIGRPMLFDFLDRLRDRQMIPEPKDYPGWRRRIIDLEKAAASGLYEETWNLAGGQTYRVLGRPHADGAMALLFEDISTEMTRTRRFRADVELGQSVIDAMDEAVAVFSSAGQLVLSNTAYSELWDHDPAAWVGGDASVAALADHWRGLTAPSPIWGEAEDFVTNPGNRVRWTDEARLSDGRLLMCRFVPLAGGASMIAFRLGVQEAGATGGFVSSRSLLRA